MGGGIASSAAPVLVGLLTVASWRLIFPINSRSAHAALVAVARTRPSPRRDVPFDRAGFGLAVAVQIGLKALAGPNVGTDNVQSAGTIMAALPIFLLLVVFQRHFVRGLSAGAVKG